MKKTFPLHVSGKDDARVLEAIKGDIRKYLKRERRKKFPEGFDLWDFNCKLGSDAESAVVTTAAEIIPALDALVTPETTQVYVEILAFASNRQPKPALPASADVAPPEA
jgi:hypothetical protein